MRVYLGADDHLAFYIAADKDHVASPVPSVPA